MKEIISPKKLQVVYFSVALFSTCCVVSNTCLPLCAKVITGMCVADLYFVKKKDMIVHHLLVISMLHSMHNHSGNPNINQMTSAVLSSEISTVFLTLNNLIDNSRIKPLVKLTFFLTFVYYRLYNYSYYLLLDREMRNSYLVYSANSYVHWEICISIYGLFLVNVYWSLVIMEKTLSDRMRKIFR